MFVIRADACCSRASLGRAGRFLDLNKRYQRSVRMSMPLQLVLSYVTFDANGSRVSNSRRVLCVFLFGGILLWLK